jgi:hypothetical protein
MISPMTLFRPEKYISTAHLFPYSWMIFHCSSPIFFISLAVLPLRGDVPDKVLKFFLSGICSKSYYRDFTPIAAVNCRYFVNKIAFQM